MCVWSVHIVTVCWSKKSGNGSMTGNYITAIKLASGGNSTEDGPAGVGYSVAETKRQRPVHESSDEFGILEAEPSCCPEAIGHPLRREPLYPRQHCGEQASPVISEII